MGKIITYVGLVQPIANWAKRDEPNQGGRPVSLGGWWIMVCPVAGTVRGHSSPRQGPSNLTTRVPLSASPYHIITTLLTARVGYFLRSLMPANHYLYPFKATAYRVLAISHHHQDTMAPRRASTGGGASTPAIRRRPVGFVTGRGPTPLIPWTGPCFSPRIFNGDPSG